MAGEWTWLLERECSVLLSTHSVVSLDLADVSYVDRGGIEILDRLSRLGVEIWCRWEPVASVLEGEGVHVRRNFSEDDEPN
jgi:ABC-type nitrate/sulfonate/bicarbonate transport system substrate-binding protein